MSKEKEVRKKELEHSLKSINVETGMIYIFFCYGLFSFFFCCFFPHKVVTFWNIKYEGEY